MEDLTLQEEVFVGVLDRVVYVQELMLDLLDLIQCHICRPQELNNRLIGTFLT